MKPGKEIGSRENQNSLAVPTLPTSFYGLPDGTMEAANTNKRVLIWKTLNLLKSVKQM